MRRNNFSQLNPRHCYEQHLSPFGQKVLNTLINKWNKDRERNSNENFVSQHTEYHNNCTRDKVLTFRDGVTSRSPRPALTFNPADTAPAPPLHASLLQNPTPGHMSLLQQLPLLQPNFLEIGDAPRGNDVNEDPPIDFPINNDSPRGAPSMAHISAELVNTAHCQKTHPISTPPNMLRDNSVQTALANNNGRKVDIEDIIVNNNKKKLFVFRPYKATEHYDDSISGDNSDNRIREEESAGLLKTRNVDWDTFRPDLATDNHDDTTGLNFYNRKLNFRNVGWDDMFDTELLSDIDCMETTSDIQVNPAAKENTLHKKISKSKPKKISKPVTTEPHINTNKNAKRKNQSKLTDSIPKKIKKPAIEFSEQYKKNKLRKQKYTKGVNDWLNNVDPQHTVEEDNIDSANIMEMSPKLINKETVKSSKNEASETTKDENISEKSVKKVVQAQLTNKNGVMKFAKPKKHNSKTDQSVINETKDKNESVKDKIPKSKFVAPIKSQIPVKDISYEIISINEKNIEKHRRNIVKNEKGEILMILMYTNGFCQLNQQHTEDSCAAEGILTCIGDYFYYFKVNTLNYYEDFILHLLNNNTIICFDGKELLLTLMSRNIEVSSVECVDAKIGGALLAPDNAPQNFADLQKLLKFTPQFTIATECVLEKAAWYTSLLRDSVTSLKALLLEDSLWDVFFNIEMKLLPIIADMQQRGVLVDMEQLKSMESVITARMKEVEATCHRAAGRPFQVTSAPQVRALLYDELQLDSKTNIKIRETVTKGAKSTSEAMLKTLTTAHPLPKLILEYRHLHKAHTTFVTGIAQLVKDGVVKPSWDQTAAATGRIASNNPNLQAIPKTPFSLILFPGPEDEELQQQQQLRFRSVYVARGGHTLLAADFQHVECRVFAHAAADTALLDALRSEQDLFRVLAAKWLSKPEPEVSKADRERTKRIVYASLYGAGARKLMDILDVSYEQALCVSASFNKTFPSLRGFGRAVVERCRGARGRLATLAGRARRFPDICSADFALRSHAERQAINFVIQGSAADLCKLAMAAAAAALRAVGVRAWLLLQIHDELVWEVRHEDLHTVAGAVRAAMESCGARCGLALRLPVALSAGASWGDMHEYNAH